MLHHSLEHNSDPVAIHMENSVGNLKPAIDPNTLFELCKRDEQLKILCEKMFKYCTEYAHDVYAMELQILEDNEKRERGEYSQEDFQKIAEKDKRRHDLHNAVIDSINILIRNMVKEEVIESDEPWAREVTNGGRASCAHFALLTFYKRAT